MELTGRTRQRQPAGLDDHHFRRDRRADLGRRRTATTTAGDLAAAGGVPRPLSLRRWRALFQIGRFLAWFGRQKPRWKLKWSRHGLTIGPKTLSESESGIRFCFPWC